MREIIEYIATTVLGGFLGYFIRLFIEHRLAIDRIKETIRITEFNKAAAAFRSAFVEVKYFLRQDASVDDSMIQQIITIERLIEQEKAKIVFESFLDKSSLEGLNRVWKEYEECRINYGKMNPNPTRAEERRYCLNHIEGLLVYATPKY